MPRRGLVIVIVGLALGLPSVAGAQLDEAGGEAGAGAESETEAASEAESETESEAASESGSGAGSESEAGSGAGSGSEAEAGAGAGDEGGEAPAPKVAVVLVGDPDERMRGLARRVDRAIERRLRRPFDPGLRAALRGEAGERGDGLAEVRNERRRLGLGEARDAPILATLGRRAGAVAVAVVRGGDEGPELAVLDVRNGQFFEGTMPLTASAAPERVAEFVARRAAVSARGQVEVATPIRAAPDGAVAADEPSEETPADEPDFFEQYWPYMVAAALLAGMIAAIAVTSAADAPDQPVLRFVPGGP